MSTKTIDVLVCTDVLVCDVCGKSIEEGEPRQELVIVTDNKKEILHACDYECLSDLVIDHTEIRVILDNRSNLDKELRLKVP